MKKLIGNRKGADAFTFILTIIAVSVLILILVGLTMKYNSLANTIGGAGSSASLILSTYDTADGALLYLDNAASLSMQGAIYDFACNGFKLESGCGAPDNYVMWSRGSAVPAAGGYCTASVDKKLPGDYSAFEGYFTGRLDQQIAAYNKGSGVKLPEDNYELRLGRPGELKGELCAAGGEGCFDGKNPGELQLVGVAQKPVVVEDGRVRYEVLPSFRENSDVDLTGDFGKVKAKADALIGNIRNEGPIGSYEGLGWNVEKYSKACGRACNTGASCKVCHDECETGSDGKRTCRQVCYPGEWIHYYCDVTAGMGARIIDENYKKSGSEGYKAFVTSEGGRPEAKEYKYRFGLNWVEMQGAPVCVLI